MKFNACLFVVFLIFSCNKTSSKKRVYNYPKIVALSLEDSIRRSYNIGTLNKVKGKILNESYNAFLCDDDYSGCITNKNNDTVFKESNLQSIPIFKDFDNDGCTDVLFKSNIDDSYNLIMFDKKNRKFKKVENFIEYPDPVNISRSKYFYSYHSSGCADECWDSDLFFIENFNVIKIGNISRTIDTDDTKYEDVIVVNKIRKGRKILYGKIDFEIIEQQDRDKWKFIEEYWNKNYSKFEN